MNTESSSTLPKINDRSAVSNDTEPIPVEIPQVQIRLKQENGIVKLILPTEAQTPPGNWNLMWEQLQQRLQGGRRFWQPLSAVHLIAQDRLLDARQLQAIADALNDIQLEMQLVTTSRRQTAVAAATAGYSVSQQPLSTPLVETEKEPNPSSIAEPLYLQMTVRSGMDIRHQGSVIIMGDINPGGEVFAAGDIIIWGRLRGMAHAGCLGNTQCLIVALHMEPTQLRIAEYVARAPENPPPEFEPEMAYVTPEGIRIARAMDMKITPFLRDLGIPYSPPQ
jgi:septum site-determining protein MinC